MFWKKIWEFFKSVWQKLAVRKRSDKNNTVLDTASVKLFGLDIRVTREIPANTPYELTVIVPRAELRGNIESGSLEVILNSITIAHSPRIYI